MKTKYILFQDGLDFHVSGKSGTKRSYYNIETFVGFYGSEKAAYGEAIKRTERLIETLTNYKKRYKRNARKASDL